MGQFFLDLHRFLARHDRHYLRAVAVVFVLAAAASVVVVLRPIPIKIFVEPPTPGGWLTRLEQWFGGESGRVPLYVAMILGIELSLLTLRILGENRSAHLAERFVRKVRASISATLLRGPLRNLSAGGAGSVLAAASSDLESVQRLLREVLVNAAVASLQLLLMLIVVFFIESWLFWILAAEIALLATGIAVYAQWRKKRYLRKIELEAKMLGLLAGLYQKNLDIRFTGLRAIFLGRLARLSRLLYGINLLLWRRHGVYHACTDFAIGLSAAGCLVLLIVLAGGETPPLGTFLVFVYYSVLIFPNLSQIGEAVPIINDARAALARIGANTGALPAKRPADAPPERFGEIVFDDVSFRGDGGETILNHVSFIIRPGERFGIFGDSGTGKTSILTLILGLNEPTGGRVLIDGKPAASLSLASRKRLFFFLRAQPAFAPGSVAENIQLNAALDPAALRQVTDAVGFTRRLQSDPAGIGMAVGEKGEPFSGGEQQRINLARAFLTNSPCMILDEALNSLDEDSEIGILGELIAARPETTLIVISHRRSVTRLFPRRLEVVRGGKVTLIEPVEGIPLASHAATGKDLDQAKS